MVTNVKYEYMNEQIEEGLKCLICRAPFIDPISTSCRHAFCRRCINDKLTKKSSCPECDHSLSLNDLTPMVLFVCKMLDDLLVKCSGCGQNGIKRSQFHYHIEEICPETLISCSAADIRCPWKGRAKQLNLHRESCDYERLRVVLTELIAENEKLKRENCSYQTPDTILERKSKSIQDQRTEHAAPIAQLTEEVNFMRDVICHRNEALKELIKRSARHSEIDLRKQKLTDLDMGIIVQKSIIERQCTVLQLQGNKITDQAISLLVHGLRNNTTMTKLNLSHNPISDVGVHLLAKLLAMNNTKIEKLYLSDIKITDQGAHYLAEMLRSNTTLEALGVFENQLGDQGMQKLANVLAKHNTSLKCLYIQANGLITDASVDSLIDMFNSNQSLITIDMKHSGLSANGIQRLKAAANKKANFDLNL